MQVMIHRYRVQRRGHEDILRDNTTMELVLGALWAAVVMTFSKASGGPSGLAFFPLGSRWRLGALEHDS